VREVVREVVHEYEPVTTALIAVGGTVAGVVLGWLLQGWSSRRTRAEERRERRDWARHEREVEAAERLDEALAKVFSAFQGPRDGQAHMQAFNDWSDAWVAYALRIENDELMDRYRSVATMLMELIDAEQIQGEQRPPTQHAVEAIRNARVALAHFIRDQGELPPSSFPEPAELVKLLNEGEDQQDKLGPLRAWLKEHRDANAAQTSSTPFSTADPEPGGSQSEQ
jgi:hypothetical protein